MSFLPDNYEPPTSSGNYFRANTGDNRVRILASPIIGYCSWVDGKPIRARTAQELPPPSKQGDKIRHFWALPIYNHDIKAIQVWEITQLTIMEKLTVYNNNPDWGSPVKYGLTVTKIVKGDNTSYELLPSQPKPLTDEILELYASTPVNLEALYEGGDPFDAVTPVHVPTSEATQLAEDLDSF